MRQPTTFEILQKELAADLLPSIAPEEQPVFDQVATEYFAAPDAMFGRRGADHPLGFGVDLALNAPYLLAVSGPVLTFLTTVVTDAASDAAKELALDGVKHLLRRRREHSPDTATGADDGRPSALTPEQAERVRTIARERAITLGLPSDQADLMADAFVGACIVESAR